MQRLLLFSLLIFFLSGCKKEFQLVVPDSEALKTLATQGDFYGDVLHLYFTENYKATSGKKEIKTYDYDPDYECGFTQDFKGGIVFKKEQCIEAGGVNWAIQLPKIPEAELKTWVEKIYAAELPDFPGEWTSEMEYGTEGGEAGCYYSLSDKGAHWQVIVWCGS
ncbi:MAG: hypothetical protein OER83_06230 [Flavobacteriaceae bacterium]|nr:hypothetical protein [Flavobacteriaceae bacterium]MDH3796452.1 hypothetical protein [Flavobacteriaceae bacterium]